MKPTTIGAIWIIGAMALIALGDNFTPLVTDHMGLWQFHALRSSMVIPAVILFAWATGRMAAVWPGSPRRVVQRSLLSMVAMVMYFAALPAIGIAQSVAGLFTSPIWVVLVSALCFGEPVGTRRVVAAVLGFAGVCLVLGVGARPVKPMALVAVAGGLAWALSVIWTRRHCLGESAICLAVWQFGALLLAGLAGLALVPWFGPALAGVEGAEFATQSYRGVGWEMLLILFLIGMARFIAAGCQVAGYQSGEASIMGLFDFSFLFWAPLFAWLLWGVGVSLWMAAGMALIAAAGVLAMWSGARGDGADRRSDRCR